MLGTDEERKKKILYSERAAAALVLFLVLAIWKFGVRALNPLPKSTLFPPLLRRCAYFFLLLFEWNVLCE